MSSLRETGDSAQLLSAEGVALAVPALRRRLPRMTAATGRRKSTKKKNSAQCLLRFTVNYNTRIPRSPWTRRRRECHWPRTSGFRNSHEVGETPGLTVDGAKKAPGPEGAEGGCVFARLFIFCFISRCLSSWIISISQTTEHLKISVPQQDFHFPLSELKFRNEGQHFHFHGAMSY